MIKVAVQNIFTSLILQAAGKALVTVCSAVIICLPNRLFNHLEAEKDKALVDLCQGCARKHYLALIYGPLRNQDALQMDRAKFADRLNRH